MTLHVFDAQGREIPDHGALLMEESRTIEDLEALIIENARKDLTKRGEF